MSVAGAAEPVRTIGRYALFDEIAAGGMATVHLGRLLGPVGFSRTVAIKRLHAHFAKDPDFSAGFVDEARLAARIHHPNVVPIIDVLNADGELSLVMDYVEGDSLAKLLRTSVILDEEIPLNIVSAVVCGSLYGLHAAHEAVDESGEPMHIVHRDISPQNILVGSDGVPRIVDFGVAKAAQRLQTTADGQVKGKIAYMAPEQIRQALVSRKTDVYAMGVVLWESITGKRLYQSENQANLMSKVLEGNTKPPSSARRDCPPALDALVMKALSPKLGERFETAREMAAELQKVIPPAPQTDVGDWVNLLARDSLTDRRRVVKRVESRELPTDGDSAQEFVARSSNEDLLTVIDKGPHHNQDGDSTQAVTTGRGQGRGESSRIFVPLVLGLGVVIGIITAVLVRNEPQLQDGRPDTSVKATTDARRRSEDPQPQPMDEPSDDGATDGAESAAMAPDEPANTATPDVKPVVVAAPTETPPTETPVAARPPSVKKPPCPKFIVDAEGIQRINRKCWK